MPRKNPGPEPLSRELVIQATKAVLQEMTTIDGMPYDEWLMDLTLEELQKLPLDAWERTTEGFKRRRRKKTV